VNTSELDYDLPGRLIAQEGLADRASARLLVLDRRREALAHRQVRDLGEYLAAGDCLVLNDSRVIPARFSCRRQRGGRIEGLFLQATAEGDWLALLKNGGRVRIGERMALARAGGLVEAGAPVLKAVQRGERGVWRLRAEGQGDYLRVLEEYGRTPLPPYIRRSSETDDAADRERYQTVYARAPGSVAAPTAGLHFTEELLQELRGRGVGLARLTLHVGLGTFQSVTTERVEDHPMHSEAYHLGEVDAALINEALAAGGRVVAAGSTSVRTLETVAREGRVEAGTGWTKLLMAPGYEFRIVGGVLTNFHLPRTTLLALACAFGGRERVLAAYREAVRLEYRFYSYGDAMLIL